MATATLQVRIDSDLKQETESVLKSMGLSMSTAIHLFFRQVINQGRIPFDIIAAPQLNEETRRAMDDAMRRFQAGMDGQAEKAGFASEDDVAAWITESRHEEMTR